MPHTNEPPHAAASLAVHGEALALSFFEVSHSRLAGEIGIYYGGDAASDIKQAYCHRHGLGAVCRAELAHRRMCVLIDSSLGDLENLSDLPRRLSLGRPGEQFTLTCRELRLWLRSGCRELLDTVEPIER